MSLPPESQLHLHHQHHQQQQQHQHQHQHYEHQHQHQSHYRQHQHQHQQHQPSHYRHPHHRQSSAGPEGLPGLPFPDTAGPFPSGQIGESGQRDQRVRSVQPDQSVHPDHPDHLVHPDHPDHSGQLVSSVQPSHSGQVAQSVQPGHSGQLVQSGQSGQAELSGHTEQSAPQRPIGPDAPDGPNGQRAQTDQTHHTANTVNEPVDPVSKPKKKKRRPGWKGWVEVIEDEEGNVLEVRERGESPVKQLEPATANTDNASATGHTATTATTGGSGSRPSTGTTSSGTPPLASHDSAAATTARTTARTRTSTPQPSHHVTITTNRLTPARANKSASPRLPLQVLPEEKQLNSKSHPRASSKAPSDAPLSKRRKRNSPAGSAPPPPSTDAPNSITTQPASLTPSAPTSAPLLSRSNSNGAVAPRPRGRPPRNSLPASSAQAPTRAQAAAAREVQVLAAAASSRDGRTSSRASPSHVVQDDTPLPVPRAGMGEGGYPVPKESDIRSEARFLIEAAAKYAEERRAKGLPALVQDKESEDGDWQQLTPPLTAETPKTQRVPTANANANGTGTGTGTGTGNGNGTINGNVNSNSQQLPTPVTAPGPSASASGAVGPSSLRSTNGHMAVLEPDPFTATTVSERIGSRTPVQAKGESDFEAQFDASQRAYSARDMQAQAKAAHTIMYDEYRQPRWHEGQRLQVQLAPTSVARARPRDRLDRQYQDGLEGLTPELERDAEGFVMNVRDNIKSIVAYHFRQPSTRRDAWLEAVGRGLVDFGWQLTDSGDAAIER